MLAYWWSIFIEDKYYHAVPSRQATEMVTAIQFQ